MRGMACHVQDATFAGSRGSKLSNGGKWHIEMHVSWRWYYVLIMCSAMACFAFSGCQGACQ
jgi:hypothetical protein